MAVSFLLYFLVAFSFQDFLLWDLVNHGALGLMALGARQESCIWLRCGLNSGLPGMEGGLLCAARWWLRTYPVGWISVKLSGL